MNVDWQYARYAAGEVALPGFPQAGWCFDAGRARAVLAPCLPRHFATGEWSLAGVYHKPAGSLEIVYEVVSGAPEPAAAAVLYLPAGRSPNVFRDAVATSADPARVLHVPEHDAVIRLFPEDDGLAHLGSLADAVAGTAGAPGGASASWRAGILSYRRGDRCTLLVSAGAGTALVAKMHGAAAIAHARLDRLFDAKGDGFAMARPLSCNSDLPFRLESFAEGQRLERVMASGDRDSSMGQLATGLAALHRAEVARLDAHTAEGLLHRFRNVTLKRIAKAGLGVAADCAAIAGLLGDTLPSAPERAATLHGDLHSANVLFAADRVTFIDMDGICKGDAAFDLAMLGSRLVLLALLDPVRRNRLLAMAAELPDAYRRADGLAIGDASYAWHMAALLVARQVKTCINNAAPDTASLASTLAGIARQVARAGSVTLESLTAQPVAPAAA